MSHAPFKGSKLAKARSRVAVAARVGTPDEVTTARRDFAAVKLEQYVQRVVAEAPPLTQEQADKIAVLLRGGAA